MKPIHLESRWKFPCSNPDYPSVIHNLSEFAEGAPDKKVGQGAYNWIGGFRGRPGLIEDLLPVIRSKYSKLNATSFKTVLDQLRGLFRFLDGYERLLEREGVDVQEVERLYHLTGTHLELMAKPAPEGWWPTLRHTQLQMIRTVILDAILANDLPEIHVQALPSPRRLQKDVPRQEEGLSLIRYLRSEVVTIFARWRRADKLAATGRNLLDIANRDGVKSLNDLELTEADAHTTYRALIEHTGNPLPSPAALREVLGLPVHSKLPLWWPHYSNDAKLPAGAKLGSLISFTDLSLGLYPWTDDLMLCSLLCLGRSGWNPSTLFSLNIGNWFSQYDDQATWVFAPKGRSEGAFQYTVSRTADSTSVFGIVKAIIARSAPIRAWLERNRHAHPTPDIALRSPWLGVSSRVNLLLFTVDPTQVKVANDHLKLAIARHNQWPRSKLQVRDTTIGDFRDIAAAWVYRNSRYSVWVTMLFLDHKQMSTTRGYLDTQAARQESHAAVKSVMDDVFEQIVVTRTWDAALTRAKVEGIDVSDGDKSRLNWYRSQRTYDGSVCEDHFNPPRNIDPANPRNGKVRCIQGHRCVASRCPLAKVFNESLPWIARRAAELEWQEEQTGMVRFSVSTDESDLEELRRTLKQWPEKEVEKELKHWLDRLRDGTHRPLRIAGQH